MNQAIAVEIQRHLSQERLAPYRTLYGGDLSPAIRLYAWNVEISAALHGPLGVLEVVVRNALHRELAVLARRSDWWMAGSLVVPRETARIQEARNTLAQRPRPA